MSITFQNGVHALAHQLRTVTFMLAEGQFTEVNMAQHVRDVIFRANISETRQLTVTLTCASAEEAGAASRVFEEVFTD